jgi:hypothetical protein
VPKTMEKSEPAVRKSRTAKAHPTHEEISLRAYQIYLERGCTPGNPMDDWTRAERELIAKKTQRRAAPKSKAA